MVIPNKPPTLSFIDSASPGPGALRLDSAGQSVNPRNLPVSASPGLHLINPSFLQSEFWSYNSYSCARLRDKQPTD